MPRNVPPWSTECVPRNIVERKPSARTAWRPKSKSDGKEAVTATRRPPLDAGDASPERCVSAGGAEREEQGGSTPFARPWGLPVAAVPGNGWLARSPRKEHA